MWLPGTEGYPYTTAKWANTCHCGESWSVGDRIFKVRGFWVCAMCARAAIAKQLNRR